MIRGSRSSKGALILLALVAVAGPLFLFGLSWLWVDTHLADPRPSACQNLTSDAVARIEASLTIPGDGHLRAAQYVGAPEGWVIAADVQGPGIGGTGIGGDRGVGVWLLAAEGAPWAGGFAASAPLYAVNDVATQVSNAPVKTERADRTALAMQCVSG
jgi:hypothetical protein